jgi:putative GTP pyrophosphokinase
VSLSEALESSYQRRRNLLELAAEKLKHRVWDALDGVSHIDRVSFRTKGTASFVRKCIGEDGQLRLDASGSPKYSDPLEEVEDQIAGRILVFFRDDLDLVEGKIREWFRASVEYRRKAPSVAAAFGYESDHFIFVIDEHMKPAGWDDAGPMPSTFELQVRTLFMHAFAEPQHDLGYKGGEPLDSETEREFAWIAASAWGADRTMNDLYQQLGRS